MERRGPPRSSPLRLGVLVSGAGTTMMAIDEAIRAHRLTATIALVASTNPLVPAVKAARERGLRVAELPASKSMPVAAWEQRLSDALKAERVELVVLAGFLRILAPAFVDQWKGRIVNIHPSLLPKFSGRGMYGTHVHAAVLASGDRETGASVHIVIPAVDDGPVVGQARWSVKPGETPEELSERQKPLERELLVQVLQRFSEGELPLPYPLPSPP